MAEYLSEQEQVDRIKAFIKTHGSNILTAVLLVLAAYFFYQYMHNQRAAEKVQASNQFQQIEQMHTGLTDKSAEGDKTKFYATVTSLVDGHPKSVYAINALLLQAQVQLESDKPADAEKSLLKAAATDVDDAGLTAIARLRLAQVQLSQNKAKQAVETLAKVTLPAFTPSKNELIGDAYVRLNDLEKAKQAYQTAWDALAKREEPRPILRLKMEEIGLKPQVIEAPKVLKDIA